VNSKKAAGIARSTVFEKLRFGTEAFIGIIGMIATSKTAERSFSNIEVQGYQHQGQMTEV
jgi:hypothetical protein